MMTMHNWKTWQLRRKMKARLARATGRDRQRLIDGLGCSPRDILGTPCQWTPYGIALYASDQSRAIRNAEVIDEDCQDGTFTLLVRMRWWAWIGLGMWHRSIRRNLENTRDMWCPAGIVATVVVR